MFESAISILKENGIISKISRHTGIARCNVSLVVNGRRRATVKQAALLEEEFIRIGVPINRWDMLYGMEKDESFCAYLNRKEA